MGNVQSNQSELTTDQRVHLLAKMEYQIRNLCGIERAIDIATDKNVPHELEKLKADHYECYHIIGILKRALENNILIY